MAKQPVDPGYGDPDAPVGTVEWAKRWRLSFQGIVKDLPPAPQASYRLYKLGVEHRAWTLITNEDGVHYRTFDEFCQDKDPYGLEMDPAKFRAYLVAELGDRATDMITVSPDGRSGREHDDQGRFVAEDHSTHDAENGRRTPDKETRLRAILRAPELVQDLYRAGHIAQTVAARMGPKSPTPEDAARIAGARQELEAVDRTGTARQVMARTKEIVERHLGARGNGRHAPAVDVAPPTSAPAPPAAPSPVVLEEPTPLQLLFAAWKRASREEKEAFLTEVGKEGW